MAAKKKKKKKQPVVLTNAMADKAFRQAKKNHMKQTGRWGTHKFKVSAKKILGFRDLKIKGTSATEEMIKDNTVYAKRKHTSPTEISMVVSLNAATNCDVRSEALGLVEDARKANPDYFYVGGSKIVPQKLLLTSASVDEIAILPSGKWASAQVSLSFRTSGTGGKPLGEDENKEKEKSGGGGSGGGTAKQTLATAPVTQEQTAKAAEALKGAAKNAAGLVKKAFGLLTGGGTPSTVADANRKIRESAKQASKNSMARKGSGGKGPATVARV